MITYELKFDDGEHICYKPSLEEAKKYRSENNFKYISRSIHIYSMFYSKVRGCKLHSHPVTKKLI